MVRKHVIRAAHVIVHGAQLQVTLSLTKEKVAMLLPLLPLMAGLEFMISEVCSRRLQLLHNQVSANQRLAIPPVPLRANIASRTCSCVSRRTDSQAAYLLVSIVKIIIGALCRQKYNTHM